MEILGNTLELVALEKCGIIRSGVPVISAVEQPAIIEVIKQYAADKKTTLYLMNRDFQVELISTELDKQVFDFQGPFRRIPGIEITLNGIHQPKNAAVAMMVLEVLRQYQALLFDEEALYTGFRQTNWAGRLEMISQHPRLLIDGAHNPEGAEVLSASLREVYSYKKIHFMIGMLSMKNHSGYLRHILSIVDSLIITEPNFRNKMDAEQLAEQAVKLVKEIDRTIEIVVEPDWKKALELLRLMTETEDLGVVSGTLYLISDVRSWVIDGSDSEKGW
jgi:dihydrofolate synthase/folylpolyglutamate synthase